MVDRQLQDVFFYALESAVKSYRRFAQARIAQSGIDITIDQWLVLTTIHHGPDLTQQQIAGIVFKDFASVTRIVQLLVTKGYLRRETHDDGRRSTLLLTTRGHALLEQLEPLVRENRKQALRGISDAEVQRLRQALAHISDNCRADLRE